MHFYKNINLDGELQQLTSCSVVLKITDPLIIEITEEEYNTLQAEIQAKWEAENPPEEETDEIATEADYVAALQEVGVEV